MWVVDFTPVGRRTARCEDEDEKWGEDSPEAEKLFT